LTAHVSVPQEVATYAYLPSAEMAMSRTGPTPATVCTGAIFASPSSNVLVLTGSALVTDDRSPRRNTDQSSSIIGRPDRDREPVFAEGRRRSATRMPETTAIQPPGADIWSGADIHWASCAVVARISVAT
jgi:hypothetical protein